MVCNLSLCFVDNFLQNRLILSENCVTHTHTHTHTHTSHQHPPALSLIFKWGKDNFFSFREHLQPNGVAIFPIALPWAIIISRFQR